jgi:hypothetical protein
MRRLLLTFLMLLLPLQWAWGAASACFDESGSNVSHFEQDTHKQDGAKVPADQQDLAAPCCHPACGVCHGVSTAFPPALNVLPMPGPARIRFASYECVVPNRTLDTPLRPPSPLVA